MKYCLTTQSLIYNNSQMGNTNQQIQKQLHFIQRIEDKYFGAVDIFKNNEGIYVMKLDRHHVKGDLQQQSHHKILEYVGSQQQNSDIIPIVNLETHSENGFCLAYECTSVYTEYYNHTLADMLQSKKTFQEPELWLILKTMLKLIVRLKQNKIAIHLNLTNIFLTLKGLPCISHHHLYSIQNSIACCQYSMAQQLAKIIVELSSQKNLSEEESLNESLQLAESVVKVTQRYKLLGKLVKQLLKKQKGQRQVLEEVDSLQISGIIRVAKEIKLTKFRYVIPDPKIQNAEQFSKSINQHLPSKTTTEKDNIQPLVDTSNKPKKANSNLKTDSTARKAISSSTNKKIQQTTKKQSPAVKDFGLKNNFVVSKEESIKMLSDLERRKQQYQNQMQRFIMRKEELLCQSEKQNHLKDSRPVLRETEPKKKPTKDEGKKKKVDNGTRLRFR